MEGNNNILQLIKMFGLSGYDLTPKQNHDFQHWKERQMKYEEESRRKQPFMLMSMRPEFGFEKEEKYFNRWIEQQKKKGEVFKKITFGKK
jgi:predicted RNA-binding protein with RPS1 domain